MTLSLSRTRNLRAVFLWRGWAGRRAVALWAAMAAGHLNARLLASDREAQRLGLQALTAGDGFGQGLARAAAALLGTRLVDFLGALGGVGQHEHLVARDLQEAAADGHGLLGAALLDPDHAGLGGGQLRRVAGQ